jgi:hypothetical protein
MAAKQHLTHAVNSICTISYGSKPKKAQQVNVAKKPGLPVYQAGESVWCDIEIIKIL